MRPADAGAALRSTTRSTRNGRRGWLAATGRTTCGRAAGSAKGRDAGRAAWPAEGREMALVDREEAPRRAQVSVGTGDDSQPINACKGEKRPDTVNNAIPMATPLN